MDQHKRSAGRKKTRETFDVLECISHFESMVVIRPYGLRPFYFIIKRQMKIEEIKIDSLIPYEYNNKKHDETQVNRLANSIKEFGFIQPIVIDKNNIVIIGHGRLEGAKKLGLKTVPCVKAETLSEEQVKKLRILDNKLNESERDTENLQYDLSTLKDFNIGDLEISIDDLFGDMFPEDLNEELGETTEDEVPDVKKTAIVQKGDIFQIGKHRLMCGSSTDCVDVGDLLGDETAKLLFTSPPYSDMREYNGNKELSVSHIVKFIEAYSPYCDYQCVNLGIQRKNGEVFEYRNDYIAEARSVGYKLLSRNVRDKMKVGSIGQQTAMFPIRHERIFVFGKDFLDLNLAVEKKDKRNIGKTKSISRRNADGTMTKSEAQYSNSEYKKMESILECISEVGEIRSEHPAVFPVKLPGEYIKAMTKENEIVVEPFGGSGSTLIACEQLNRICKIMELDERYCEVILRRFHKINPDAEIKCVNRDVNIKKILSDDE